MKLSNTSKDRILSVIGHDLRGPVGGLNALIELYMDMPDLDANDIDKLLKNAFESSTGTYMLLENLLTWANSQRGVISFYPQSQFVYGVVNQVVQMLDKSMNNRHVHFKIDVKEELKAFIDIDMFKSVLRNLISNSIKFSRNNSSIYISAKEDKNAILFCVQDEGIGMVKELANELFAKKESYYLENNNTGKGTGLGLILCKEFVERHGGNIWVESKVGVGSWFYFTIPNQFKSEEYKDTIKLSSINKAASI